MRVLVTGAGGFVGRRLVARLGEAGHEATGIDVDVDVTDPAAARSAVGGVRPDAVVHLAAISSVANAALEPATAFRVNFLGTRHVLEACAELTPGSRFVFVGSGAVYGTAGPDAPAFEESAPLLPESPYAHTKAAADLLASQHAVRGLSVVRARPFNHTGAGRPETFVESSFARQVAEIEAGGREPTIRVGNLDSVRDFLHVEDVVDAYLRLIDPSVRDGAYNVASGVGRRIGDLLDRLLALADLGGEVRIVRDSTRFRPTDRAVGNAKRLHEETGWAPGRSFASTLAELLDDWRERVRSSAPSPAL